MRKILSLVLALSMVLGMFSFAFAADLSDVDGEYFEASVEALVELGVVDGFPDGTYRPNTVVTRAQLAKMLVICLGQEDAAKIAKGTTQFTDVPEDHWASGYINVASQSKIVVGYPDGTFAPEATVTYAEAVTMVLRALGYRNVVEVAGTWPTNYITKANELQLLKDMKSVNASDDGAKRGNVAILLWNMLRTRMWDIREENQTNGMTYSEGDFMLNTKFPGYVYNDELVLAAVKVEENERKVTVTFARDNTQYELKKGDLLRMVPGMKVAALINEEDEEVLSLTCVDTLVEGRVDEDGKLNGKTYTNLEAEEDDYVVVLVW